MNSYLRRAEEDRRESGNRHPYRDLLTEQPYKAAHTGARRMASAYARLQAC